MVLFKKFLQMQKIKPPYNVFSQGGICYNSSKITISKTLEKMLNEKMVKL